MRISHRHRFVFLANPRTGSTTVRKILDDYSDIKSVHVSQVDDVNPFYHHISAAELKIIFEKKRWPWEEYRKFCMVRNPFDRVVSLYFLHQEILQGKVKGKSAFQRLLRLLKRKLRPVRDFEQYVMQINPEHRLTTSLKAFTCDSNGRQLVHDILMFENLKNDLPNYLFSLGIQITADHIPHLNASNSKKHYREYYNTATHNRVKHLYINEIEQFGYSF